MNMSIILNPQNFMPTNMKLNDFTVAKIGRSTVNLDDK